MAEALLSGGFCASIINSQPMGFYAPAQLVSCARKHGVTALPVDVNMSTWDCTLEEAEVDGKVEVCLRLGLRMISGLRSVAGRAMKTLHSKVHSPAFQISRAAQGSGRQPSRS